MRAQRVVIVGIAAIALMGVAAIILLGRAYGTVGN